MPDHIGPAILQRDDLRVIDCWTCGFMHQQPLPSQESLDAFYTNFYTKGENLLEQDARDAWYWRLVYRERMREFERLVPEAQFRWLLDYGAGLGWFIKFARKRGTLRKWIAWGYEPAQCEHVVHGIVDSLDDHLKAVCHPNMLKVMEAAGMYMRNDAIHCSLVLEHVRDPVATLRQIHDLLLPGGILCVVVPNEFNPLQERLRTRYGYTPLHETHVNYFTPETLRGCLERAGFEVLRTTATFPIEWFALHGLNYVKFPSTGKAAHTLRMLFEAALLTLVPGLKRRLYERWARKGVGREVEVWARKG